MTIMRFFDNSVHQLQYEGKIYSISTGAQSLDASGYWAVEITNPANSNNTVEISRITGGSTASATVDVLRNASIAASGVSLTPHNRNWNFADDSAMSVQYVTQATDPTSGGELLGSTISPGGIFSVLYDDAFIISDATSDRSLLLRIENNINPEMVTSSYSGSATVTQSDGMAVLQTGVASGSWANLQTLSYLRYVAGVGGTIGFTALFTPGVAGSKQVIGYGDDTDGFFFGYNGSSFGILRLHNGVES